MGPWTDVYLNNATGIFYTYIAGYYTIHHIILSTILQIQNSILENDQVSLCFTNTSPSPKHRTLIDKNDSFLYFAIGINTELWLHRRN